MIIQNIKYSNKFIKRFKKLPKDIKKNTVKKENLFKINPLHPSLRLHRLKGEFKNYWSISINRSYRIIFKRTSAGDILFMSIGAHDIYKYL